MNGTDARRDRAHRVGHLRVELRLLLVGLCELVAELGRLGVDLRLRDRARSAACDRRGCSYSRRDPLEQETALGFCLRGLGVALDANLTLESRIEFVVMGLGGR